MDEYKDGILEDDIVISEVEGKFTREELNASQTSSVEKYTEKVKKMEDAVDILDSYDDFGDLKIDVSTYERTPNSCGYGIQRTKIHGADVIFDHQKNAALLFLKNLRGFGL